MGLHFGNSARKKSDMAEKKVLRLTVDIEPTIYSLLCLIIVERSISISGYIRSLLLEDFEKHGILTKDALLRITK